MLTGEAERERRWMGLTQLRETLETRFADFERHQYPMSISESEFDRFHRVLLLASFVTDSREVLLNFIREQHDSSPARPEPAAIANELRELRSRLDWVENRTASLRNSLGLLARDLERLHLSRADRLPSSD